MQAGARERFRCVLLALMASMLLGLGDLSVASAQTAGAEAGPVRLTAEQDHQRLMGLLHIASLRRGPSGDPLAPDAANVDESKVPPYMLPDPLVLKNGKRVTDVETWWKSRRLEIVEEFDREIVGREPQNAPRVKWEAVSASREEKGGIPVVTKNVLGHVDNAA